MTETPKGSGRVRLVRAWPRPVALGLLGALALLLVAGAIYENAAVGAA